MRKAVFVLTLALGAAACDPFAADPGDSAGCSSEGCAVSGYIETEAGRPHREVKVTLRSGSHRLFGETDKDGRYEIIGAVLWRDYCVTPKKGPWEFDPPEHCIKAIDRDHSGLDFVAAHVDSFDISGQVFDMHGPLRDVAVFLTGHATKNTRTNSQGFYAFRSLRGREDYRVFPSKPSYTFEPTERRYTYLDSTFDDEDYLATESE